MIESVFSLIFISYLVACIPCFDETTDLAISENQHKAHDKVYGYITRDTDEHPYEHPYGDSYEDSYNSYSDSPPSYWDEDVVEASGVVEPYRPEKPIYDNNIDFIMIDEPEDDIVLASECVGPYESSATWIDDDGDVFMADAPPLTISYSNTCFNY